MIELKIMKLGEILLTVLIVTILMCYCETTYLTKQFLMLLLTIKLQRLIFKHREIIIIKESSKCLSEIQIDNSLHILIFHWKLEIHAWTFEAVLLTVFIHSEHVYACLFTYVCVIFPTYIYIHRINSVFFLLKLAIER